jgi:hypothetical protein
MATDPVIVIRTNDTSYYLAAATKDEFRDWTLAFQSTIAILIDKILKVNAHWCHHGTPRSCVLVFNWVALFVCLGGYPHPSALSPSRSTVKGTRLIVSIHLINVPSVRKPCLVVEACRIRLVVCPLWNPLQLRKRRPHNHAELSNNVFSFGCQPRQWMKTAAKCRL